MDLAGVICKEIDTLAANRTLLILYEDRDPFS